MFYAEIQDGRKMIFDRVPDDCLYPVGQKISLKLLYLALCPGQCTIAVYTEFHDSPENNWYKKLGRCLCTYHAYQKSHWNYPIVPF